MRRGERRPRPMLVVVNAEQRSAKKSAADGSPNGPGVFWLGEDVEWTAPPSLPQPRAGADAA